jgi:hypothetical protein
MKTSLVALLGVLVCCFAAMPVTAQMECGQCDPYNSNCSDPCWYCEIPSIDGYCEQYNVVQSTCGDRGLGNPGCVKDGCTSNWIGTSLENRGTYGESTNDYIYVFPFSFHIVYSCLHHRVDLVTEEDVNECNQNSGYWTRTECIDYVDGWKGNPPASNFSLPFPFFPRGGHAAPAPGLPSDGPQDCCNGMDGLAGPEPLFTCNHYHACW